MIFPQQRIPYKGISAVRINAPKGHSTNLSASIYLQAASHTALLYEAPPKVSLKNFWRRFLFNRNDGRRDVCSTN